MYLWLLTWLSSNPIHIWSRRCIKGATAIVHISFDFIIIFNGTSNRCGGKFHNKFSYLYVPCMCVCVRMCTYVCELWVVGRRTLSHSYKWLKNVRIKMAFPGENSDASREVYIHFQWFLCFVMAAGSNFKAFLDLTNGGGGSKPHHRNVRLPKTETDDKNGYLMWK